MYIHARTHTHTLIPECVQVRSEHLPWELQGADSGLRPCKDHWRGQSGKAAGCFCQLICHVAKKELIDPPVPTTFPVSRLGQGQDQSQLTSDPGRVHHAQDTKQWWAAEGGRDSIKVFFCFTSSRGLNHIPDNVGAQMEQRTSIRGAGFD